jgi:2-methylisocitrate lyase-like PEP mutase family enzyme
MVDQERQSDYLSEVRAAAGADLVINARIDTFLFSKELPGGDLASGALDHAVARGRAYRRAGADCVYPILSPLGVLATLVEGIGGPINAHATPNGPTAADLIARGATRISYGTSLHNYATDALRELLPKLA